MKRELETAISGAVQELYGVNAAIELTRPEEKFGDYSTNAALQIAKNLQKSPRDIAEKLCEKLKSTLGSKVDDVSVAGPGFINLRLSNSALIGALSTKPQSSLAGKTVVAEYSDPNPFKVLHAGHLYTSVVGDAVANLLEQAGAKVHRVNFGGDVGLHVGKTMWAIVKIIGDESPEKLQEIPVEQHAEWMAEAYIAGTRAYDEDEQSKTEITDLNKRVYKIHSENDHDSPFAQIYWTCRQWSYDYFDQFYARIGSKFEKYYPESQTAALGLETVKQHIGDVYTESDGAVIFDGEKYDLHTRVFINSEGLPTYETKDVGLIMKKWQDYSFDQSVIITGNDIIEYMKVVLKSIEQFQPELPARTRHLTHGIVKLQGGTKMSSRKGNFLRAVDVLDAAEEASKALSAENGEQTVLGAVKYAFLKNRMGGDIVYNPQESVSMEGNSGPYLQYAHARARSILGKAAGSEHQLSDLGEGERSLARKISEYPEAVDKAVADLMPHHVAGYLYELAQVFNRFYEHNRVIDDKRQSQRLTLVNHYADTLKSGLGVLGITAPDKM
jgi:arginyl-tRNA synthetase